MDEKSLEILEFPEIRKALAGYTSFSASREMALALQPLSNFAEISLRLRQSAEARQLLDTKGGFSIGGASDIRETARMAALGRILDPLSLVQVQHTLAVLRQVRHSLQDMSGELPLLRDIADDIVPLPDVEKALARCLSAEGEVLDRASPGLSAVRAQLRETRQRLMEKLEGLMRSPRGRKIIQEPIITEREGRYVIPVRREFRREIKGITHDVSNTGVTVFIEPWTTMEMGNEVRELVTEERREVERVLRDLCMAVGARHEEITQGILRLAELDLALAKARYGRAAKAWEPVLADFSAPDKGGGRPCISLVDARHPLLGQKAVPLSVELGRDFSVLVITGPNTGGKTVALKTIGLLSLMAQAGMPIPAAPETRLPVFDGVFADIGDEQSIAQTLSSFSWHVGNIVRIIGNATPRSLVLLDELGASTDPAEGSALARAILKHFLSSRVLTAATTHYADLKAFAHATEGLQNASFDFDAGTLAPTYHLTLGIPGGSNALSTAARLGVPNEIIEEARALISRGALDLENTIAGLMAEKQQLAATRALLEKEKREAVKNGAELAARLKKLEEEERRIIQQARDSVVSEAAQLHKEIRQASLELRKQRSRETVDRAKQALSAAQSRLDSQAWETRAPAAADGSPIRAGDTVYLKEANLRADVLAIYETTQEVEVQAGQIRLRISLDSVSKAAPGKTAPPAARTSVSAAGASSASLDLRGKRADEVEVALDSYLSAAAVANLGEALIIHGFGTGTVRQIVRDFLAAHPLVKSFRAGIQGEGGDGVTVVSL